MLVLRRASGAFRKFFVKQNVTLYKKDFSACLRLCDQVSAPKIFRLVFLNLNMAAFTELCRSIPTSDMLISNNSTLCKIINELSHCILSR